MHQVMRLILHQMILILYISWWGTNFRESILMSFSCKFSSGYMTIQTSNSNVSISKLVSWRDGGSWSYHCDQWSNFLSQISGNVTQACFIFRRLMYKKEFDTSFVGFTKGGAQWLVDNTDIKLVGKQDYSYSVDFCFTQLTVTSAPAFILIFSVSYHVHFL